jgi:hypothetical protein
MTGSTSPFSGGLLAAKAGKTSIENNRVMAAKNIKFFFILQPPLSPIFKALNVTPCSGFSVGSSSQRFIGMALFETSKFRSQARFDD